MAPVTTKIRLRKRPAPTQSKTAILSEAFPTVAADAGVLGFILSRLGKGDAPLLWVQDRLSKKETGGPYLPGLHHKNIIRVDVNRPVDVLWAIEEGLRSKALIGVIGEVWGAPRVLDFTATKRLALRAEHHSVPCWLVRRAATPDLSAARNRWRVTSLPSLAHPHDPKAPGNPRWQVELFRSRTTQPGTWVATYDRTEDRVNFSTPFRDGAMAAGDDAQQQRASR